MEQNEFRIEILKREIDLTGTKVNHFDTLRLRTRQTAIALWIAVLGFGLKEKVPELFALATLIPIPFWVIEAKYRRYQRGWNLRLRAIREFVRDGKFKVMGEEMAILSEFLKNKDAAKFPSFDIWARQTVPEDEHRAQTSFHRNLFNKTLLSIYLSMCAIAGAVWFLSN